jgi:hypothetical protein
MKLVYLSIILGIMLLTSIIGTSYASTGSVKIVAKEKQGMILLLVRNDSNTDIYSIRLTLSDGQITDTKLNQGWVKSSPSDKKSVTLTTGKTPIKAHERATFSLITSSMNTIISWKAIDRTGSTIDSDSTRAIFRQTLEKIASTDTEQTYLSNARSLALTTDKIFYNKNDKIIISGALDANTDVLITIYAPNGQKTKIMDKTDPTGAFKTLHVLYNADSGTYRLKVRQADGYAETSFKVQ